MYNDKLVYKIVIWVCLFVILWKENEALRSLLVCESHSSITCLLITLAISHPSNISDHLTTIAISHPRIISGHLTVLTPSNDLFTTTMAISHPPIISDHLYTHQSSVYWLLWPHTAFKLKWPTYLSCLACHTKMVYLLIMLHRPTYLSCLSC